jgi:hypothetical protein
MRMAGAAIRHERQMISDLLAYVFAVGKIAPEQDDQGVIVTPLHEIVDSVATFEVGYNSRSIERRLAVRSLGLAVPS